MIHIILVLQTILDLRRMDRPCKKTMGGKKVTENFRTILRYMALVRHEVL